MIGNPTDILPGQPVKLLHKQLLVLAAPYLAIIVGVLLLHAQVIEPRIVERFQRETHREVAVHAEQIRLVLERAKAQLRLISQTPALRSGDVPTILQELGQIELQSVGPFAGITFCDPKYVVHLPDGNSFAVMSQLFSEDLKAGKDVVTDVRMSPATQRPVFLVLVPVKGADGDQVGFLVGELAVTDVWAALLPNQFKATSQLVLQVGRHQSLTPENVADPSIAAEYVNSKYATALKGLHRPVTAVSGWEQAQAKVTGLDWQVVKLTPSQEIVGPARLMRNLVVALAVLAMSTAATLLWLRTRKDSQRLGALTESLQRFGAGNAAVRLQDQTSDEIGRVAEAFNCMADDVVHAQGKVRKDLAEHETLAKDRGDRAEEMRVKADELERFASSVAHDLKAPLVTMQGFVTGLEAAARANDWNRFRDDVDRVQRTGDTLARMLESLLEFSRIGRATAASENVSLHQAATSAVELLQGAIIRLRVDVIISPDLPVVKGDPIRWRQVFQNLIDNAVKACEGVASPRIEIGCEERLLSPTAEGAGGKTLCCFVRDNGTGLEAGPLKKLFEPFTTGLPKTGGSGIGLALVKRIVALHGGRIWAESAGSGRGTTVLWSVSPVING